MSVIDNIVLECGAEIIIEKDTKISKDVINISVKDIDGKIILRKRSMGEKEWNTCGGYYGYKLDILLNPDKSTILDKPYVMFECYDRMYRITDLDYCDNHRDLLRSCEPIGIFSEESETINLMTFGGLYSLSTYQEDILVFRFDDFYLNGQIVGSFKEIEDKLGLSRTYASYTDERVKTYFEEKLHIKLAGFKSLEAEAYYPRTEFKITDQTLVEEDKSERLLIVAKTEKGAE